MEKVRAHTPQLPKRIIEVLSREEIDKLEQAARSPRDALIVRLLSETGLRASELVGLRVKDLVQHGQRTMLKATGKGARDRMVPVPPATFRRLRRMAVDLSQEDRLFRSRKRSRVGIYPPLNVAALQQMLNNLGEEAGMTKPVHAHAFRHAVATYLLQQGMNPLLVAQLLGHSSLRMIQMHYGHLTAADTYDALIEALAKG